MISAQSDHSRIRIRARSRVCLAVLVAGGVAAGGGFTLAAAQADAVSGAAGHGSGPGGHAERHRAPAGQRSEHGDDSTPAPVRAPVQAPRHPTASQRNPAPPPAGATHAS